MEMELTPTFDDDTITALYEASINGTVSAFTTLNPLSLSRVSFSPFHETLLHIAALLGHLQLCVVLLDLSPCLATKVDSEGRCPLHFASAEGHTEVVKVLLMTNSEVCLSPDKYGMLPLHLAVSRGHVAVIEELIEAEPCSIRKITDGGSVLHLCVRFNRLEALKFLVQSVRGAQQLLPAKDKEGNTVLHLAVWAREIKIIKYLLSLHAMRTAANTINRKGETALDALEQGPRDFVSVTINYLLAEKGVQRSADITAEHSPQLSDHQQESRDDQPRRWKKWENFWAKYLQYQGNWIEETRGTLMVVATVIATMTFQSALNPPGGVWQENTHNNGYNCTAYGICEAGTAILGYAWSEEFVKFLSFNTISFFASLCVVLVLISGFPLKNKVMMWILTIAMTIAVTFMLLTYMWAVGLVTPYHIYRELYWLGYVLVTAWGILLIGVGLIQIARLVFWIKKRTKKLLVNSGSSTVPVTEDV